MRTVRTNPDVAHRSQYTCPARRRDCRDIPFAKGRVTSPHPTDDANAGLEVYLTSLFSRPELASASGAHRRRPRAGIAEEKINFVSPSFARDAEREREDDGRCPARAHRSLRRRTPMAAEPGLTVPVTAVRASTPMVGLARSGEGGKGLVRVNDRWNWDVRGSSSTVINGLKPGRNFKGRIRRSRRCPLHATPRSRAR